MASKILTRTLKCPWWKLSNVIPSQNGSFSEVKTFYVPQGIIYRTSYIIPPTQYDTPFPKNLIPTKAMSAHWEIAPLIIATSIGMLIMVLSILWAINNKVDVVFFGHNRNNSISRTMNLRDPTNHKIITINQEYHPWPEMQDVLDKMVKKEFDLQKGVQRCDDI